MDRQVDGLFQCRARFEGDGIFDFDLMRGHHFGQLNGDRGAALTDLDITDRPSVPTDLFWNARLVVFGAIR